MSVRVLNGYLHLDFRFRERRYRPTTKLKDTDVNRNYCEGWDAAIHHEIAIGTFDLEKHFPGYLENEREEVAPRSFRQDADRWLEAHKITWAEWTYRKFKNNLESRVYASAFAKKTTKEIKPKDIRLLREEIAKAGRNDGKRLTNRSINKIMQPVKAVLLELFGDGEIAANPIPKNLKLKEKRVADIHPYSQEDMNRLFKAAHALEFRHYEPLVNFVFESGFRPEENYGMKWEFVDLAGMAMEIREVRTLGKLKDPKTEFAGRVIDITAGMLKWLTAQKSRSALRSPFVWITVAGNPIDQSNFARQVWKPLHEHARVKYRPPRQARHTWATHHIDRGTEPRWMALQMGTSLKQLFETYTAQWNRARDKKAQEIGKARGHVYGHGDS